jgi:5-methylcytosine-specific restriction endonuclease McrA
MAARAAAQRAVIEQARLERQAAADYQRDYAEWEVEYAEWAATQDPRLRSPKVSNETARYLWNAGRAEKVEALWASLDFRGCAGCKCELHPGNWTVDHIIPIARGGSNDLRNLQLMCRSCNSSKGTRV